TSNVPLAVWQFNPLEYKAGQGGPPQKNWACPYAPMPCNGNAIDCLSVSNDASLLMPTSALTGTYRLFGQGGARGPSSTPDLDNDAPAAYAITATHDGTQVTVALAKGAEIEVGSGVAAPTPDGKLTFALDQGDVVELLGAWGAKTGDLNSDLSGS